eukprot:GFUD01026463.1.p1 GENE.GFUD01026463.1~~GFUD01026463.1.p1  ORF type:complete len:354 (-),score=153.86 GFUD01026463.1:101-1039(-)
MENTQTLTQEEEQQRAEGGANLDVTGAGEVKKKVIRTQPKLNAERLMGPRGIQTIEDVFSDWEGRGKGKEFDDLEVVMKKMEHWAHRLYPKLPFDNVLDILANRLGKKKVVQTHVKKIRLGMVTETVHIGGEEEEEQRQQEEREVERYGEDEQPDVFGELLRRAGGQDVPLPPVQRVGQAGGLTDEQRERIRKNKELAAQKKREKQEREQREAEEELKTQQMGGEIDDEDEIEREMMSAPAATEWSQVSQEKDKIARDGDEAIEDVAEVVESESIKEPSASDENGKPTEAIHEDGSDEAIGLDEMLEQMDED